MPTCLSRTHSNKASDALKVNDHNKIAMEKQHWTFHKVPSTMPHLESREARELLLKWGLKDTIFFYAFTYDQPLQPYQIPQFLLSFLSTPDGQRCVGIRNSSKRAPAPDEVVPVEKVKTVQLSCSLTDMNLLKRFETIDAVSQSGVIKKCFPITHPDYEVIDRVREALVCDDSELFDEFERFLNPFYSFYLLLLYSIG